MTGVKYHSSFLIFQLYAFFLGLIVDGVAVRLDGIYKAWKLM